MVDNPTAGFYGLELARAVDLKTGTIYPLLARLEEHGWLTSTTEDIDPRREKRPPRRVYSLTGVGETRARETLEAHRRMLEPRPEQRGALHPLPGGGWA